MEKSPSPTVATESSPSHCSLPETHDSNWKARRFQPSCSAQWAWPAFLISGDIFTRPCEQKLSVILMFTLWLQTIECVCLNFLIENILRSIFLIMVFPPPPSTSRTDVGSQRTTCIFNICSCLHQDRKDCSQQNDQSLRNSPSTSEIFSSVPAYRECGHKSQNGSAGPCTTAYDRNQVTEAFKSCINCINHKRQKRKHPLKTLSFE